MVLLVAFWHVGWLQVALASFLSAQVAFPSQTRLFISGGFKSVMRGLGFLPPPPPVLQKRLLCKAYFAWVGEMW